MSKKQYKLQTLVIELVSVLIASCVAFQVCNSLSVQLGYFPFVLVGCYIALKLIYHICIMMVGYAMKLIHIIYRRESSPILASSVGPVAEYAPSDNAIRKRMELFHYEYQMNSENMRSEKNWKKTQCLLLL